MSVFDICCAHALCGWWRCLPTRGCLPWRAIFGTSAIAAGCSTWLRPKSVRSLLCCVLTFWRRYFVPHYISSSRCVSHQARALQGQGSLRARSFFVQKKSVARGSRFFIHFVSLKNSLVRAQPRSPAMTITTAATTTTTTTGCPKFAALSRARATVAVGSTTLLTEFGTVAWRRTCPRKR